MNWVNCSLTVASGWSEMQQKYENTQPLLIDYLVELLTWKWSFVACYTTLSYTFGKRATSRIEGNHAEIKRCLQVASGDLGYVVDRIAALIRRKHQQYLYNIGLAVKG